MTAGQLTRAWMGLAEDMIPAIRSRYEGMEVERVVDAWNKGMAGEVTRKKWEGKGSQVAASYIEGLHAEPWHEVDRYPWVASLEANAAAIRDELRRVCTEELRGGSSWLRAIGDDAEAYGPGWQRLVLQNRVWDTATCDLFPKTCETLKGCGAPSVDVFFAKQRANSGIMPHTDNSNFFVTAHLALEVPDGDCWIRVGNEKRKWLEGKALVFDSSFVHETRNDGTSNRTVLIVRFWHPQLTQVERRALCFIFSALDDSSILDEPCEAVEAIDSCAGPLELEPSFLVSEAPDAEPQGSIAAEPLGAADEAVRLDSFLADLKAEGLLPGAATTKDELLAKAPKNRNARRSASKARKKSFHSGKGKKR